MLTRLARLVFFGLVVRGIVLLVMGLNIRNRERLPRSGPAIIVANHNSHLDTLTLMSLFPLGDLDRIRPVAAMDYFLANPVMKWIATRLIGILPIDRSGRAGGNPLADCEAALARGDILILFPEGSRGEPERLARYKKGIAHLAKAAPEVPVTPVFFHGLGKALPKGSWLFVPFTCDVFVGEAFSWTGSIAGFMEALEARMSALAARGHFPPWT
ncbi:1-acyl-sn-glycerol-3-phosphate acyltransferase [Kaustia mangrovi]|uniref:1-acyl-sn-glycerol-3-phosphate acyltransferase n=1 Tax=Kaustia mangrovi TaxID=2593653 RepID=A0A7S8C8D4_9HYPH|nr:lysophospholipid acyltransferase family protein [Kaustia mangrovi]QPC45096.1 1-acyl-sn-glycerol-3-phosphate acyltransferase [Kaustia mangrovi]